MTYSYKSIPSSHLPSTLFLCTALSLPTLHLTHTLHLFMCHTLSLSISVCNSLLPIPPHPHPVLSHLTPSYPILPHPILSHIILPTSFYPIPSYCILSNLIPSRPCPRPAPFSPDSFKILSHSTSKELISPLTC